MKTTAKNVRMKVPPRLKYEVRSWYPSASDFRLQTSDFELRTSDFRL
jgi:hypothetical protein